MSNRLNLDELSKLATDLQNIDLESANVDAITQEWRKFVFGYAPIFGSRSHESIAIRARVCDGVDKWSSLKEMIYHKDGSPNFGRANLCGEKVLYASWNGRTALEEIGAKAGDKIQIINLRIRKGSSVPNIVVGEYQRHYMGGRLTYEDPRIRHHMERLKCTEPENYIGWTYIDSVLAELFREPVKKGCEHKYKITAAFTKWILQSNAILVYPSVATISAMNFAIPAAVFDTQFEVLDTAVIELRKYHGFGIYDCSEPLHYSRDFDCDGTINWISPKKRLEWGLNDRGGHALQEADFEGWRVIK